MTSIDKLIYDELARRRGVVLPGAGTLEVKRRRAKRISDTQIAPPQSEVVFSPDEVGGIETVVSLLAADRNISADEALALYGSWLEGARRPDGSIVIDGAGEVRDGGFAVAPALHAALNPDGGETVTMKPEKRRIFAWVWIVIAVIAVLAALCVLRCCKPGIFGGRSKAPVVEHVVTSTPKPDADSLAAVSASASPSSTGERFHVIAGAFVVESNADNFVAKLKREYPELTPMKLPHHGGEYNMVSIWQASTRREARNKMNIYWDVNPDLWVYEQK